MEGCEDDKMTRVDVKMYGGRRGRCENNKMICADDDICDEDPWRGSRVHSHAVSVLFEVISKENCMDGVTTV